MNKKKSKAKMLSGKKINKMNAGALRKSRRSNAIMHDICDKKEIVFPRHLVSL